MRHEACGQAVPARAAVRPCAERYERPAMEVVRMDARVMADPADNSVTSPYASSSSLLEDGVG